MYSNINSYSRKKQLINNYIENNDVNCTLFVETKTTQNTNTNYRNWHIIQRNGYHEKNVRGGSLIQAHPSLKIGKANGPKINNPLNEATHFTVPFMSSKLHIFLAYIHPHSNKIDETIFNMAALCDYALMIGDFNATSSRHKKAQIRDFLNNSDFIQAVTPPTFIMANNPDSTPDLVFYTSNLQNHIKEVEVHPDLGSDHLSIQLKIDMITQITQPCLFSLNIKKCNMEKVNSDVKIFIRNHDKINETSITSFHKSLSEAILKHSPKTKKRFYVHELPPFILKLIKHKRRMYREYRNSNDPEFKAHINQYNKNIHYLIQQYREHKWTETCKELNTLHGKNFWQQIKKLSRYKPKFNIPELSVEGKSYKSDEEKAKLFASHFSKTFKNDPSGQFDQDVFRTVNSWYSVYVNQHSTTENIVLEEDTYFDIINEGKNNSPGSDNISKAIISKLDYGIHLYIIKIYQYCLDHSHFPEEWRKGTVVCIPKPNTDHSIPSNYRPITLLSVLGKNFEKIIKQLLLTQMENKIPPYQFGFREKKFHITASHNSDQQHSDIKTDGKKKCGPVFRYQ